MIRQQIALAGPPNRAEIARRVGEDFAARYGEPVVLLETFVEITRFAGTCCRAAN